MLSPKLLGMMRRSHIMKGVAQQTNPTLSEIAPLHPSHNPTRLLSRLSAIDRIKILSEVLASCGTDEVGVFAGELVEIAAKSRPAAREAAFRAIARRFAQIGETDRDVAVRLRQASGGEWAPVVCNLGSSMTEAEGASIAMLAGWVGEPALLEHLAKLASHPDDGIAGAVEESLLRLVTQIAGMQAHTAASIGKALSAAVSAYGEHRRRGVLRAAAALWGSPAGLDQLEHLNPDGSAADWWSDATHPAQLGLRSLIRRDPDPSFARASLCWLRLPGLAPACRDRLLEAGTTSEHEALLNAAHLLAHPTRQQAIEQMALPAASSRREGRTPVKSMVVAETGKAFRWVTSPESLARVDAASRRFAPAWVAALPLPPKEKHATLGAFVGDRSQNVRHAAVRAAADLGDAEAISDFCYDDGACVAVSAATARLCLRPPAGAGLLSDQMQDEVGAWGRLARSSHEGVRRLADAALERYAGTRPGSASHTLILRRRARRGRQDVLAELKTHIDSGSENTSIGAIRAAMRLGVVDELKVELVRALWRQPPSGSIVRADEVSPFNRIAATAAAALGDADDDATSEALRGCLSHADVRVRSNALEAMGKRWRRGGVAAISTRSSGTEPTGRAGVLPSRGSGLRVLMEFKDDEHHRLRATAGWVIFMQGLLRGDASAEAWRHEAELLSESMLLDDRDEHLLAGLWLSERLMSHVEPSWRERMGRNAADLMSHRDAVIGERAVRCVERSGVWGAEVLPYANADNEHAARPLTEAA